MDYGEFIAKTLQAASKIANANFGKVVGQTKPDDNNQVLTDTDFAVGKLIVEQVQTEYPQYNLIDEEAGIIDNKSEHTWVVDPIDGTSNFAEGLPTYGIMIGLLEGNKAIAGGIALPFFDEVYIGVKGEGAFCNQQSLTINHQNDLLSSLVAYGIDGHQEDPRRTEAETRLLSKIILAIRNLRTTNSAYDLAQVAAGKYAAYLNQTTKIWDNVAFQPIVEEAGGVVTDFWGEPMDYSDPLNRSVENFTICVASPGIHAQLQRIIHS